MIRLVRLKNAVQLKRKLSLLIFWSVSVVLVYWYLSAQESSQKVQFYKMDHHNHAHHAPADHVHPPPEEGACESMHMMIFHAGVCQDILFPGWTTTNALELFGSCVVIFLAALLYEGFRCYREVLFLRGASVQTQSQMNITKEGCSADSNCAGQKIVRYSILSPMHAVQTVLHILQVFISYMLMLVFMTYNVWLCLALLLGAGAGYFLFAWKKQSVVDLNDHCH